MFIQHNYVGIEEIVIMSPSSNIHVNKAKNLDTNTQLLINKVKWPESSKLNLNQLSKKLIVEVISNGQENSQVDFNITAPEDVKFYLNVGNSENVEVSDIVGQVDLNMGNVNHLTCKRNNSVNVTAGNIFDASFEDIKDNLHFEVGSGKLKIKFNQVDADCNIYLNAGKLDFSMVTASDIPVKNSIKMPLNSVKVLHDLADSSSNSNKPTINLSGTVAKGDMKFDLFNPRLGFMYQ